MKSLKLALVLTLLLGIEASAQVSEEALLVRAQDSNQTLKALKASWVQASSLYNDLKASWARNESSSKLTALAGDLEKAWQSFKDQEYLISDLRSQLYWAERNSMVEKEGKLVSTEQSKKWRKIRRSLEEQLIPIYKTGVGDYEVTGLIGLVTDKWIFFQARAERG